MTKQTTVPNMQNELLKPRYKVIADYPVYIGGMYKHKIGDIIMFDDNYSVFLWKESGSDGTMCSEEHFQKYPAIFRELEWWEEREIEEMPKYVLFTKSTNKEVWKVVRWEETKVFGSVFWTEEDGHKSRNITSECAVLPATEEEYLNYLANAK